ncbi:hypothetical protein [Mycobacterium sp. E2989]|uniref:hypothetical protein n=1 Tax=Mycobacterium sp. E2989 TaxID=1834140 RepID=UPI000AB6E877|nr:hypothetical protein [Mycobacterium sp. E2989]
MELTAGDMAAYLVNDIRHRFAPHLVVSIAKTRGKPTRSVIAATLNYPLRVHNSAEIAGL